jgi:PncC family amidohydrolase
MKLEEKIGQWLVARRMTLAVAESCTGGLVGHRLTNVPGSSEYFLGGIIAYSNDAKQRLLGVSPDTLARFGAVSQETVREMAQGARRALEAHLAVAVTGIAGPGGGTPGKPVGLTWIALSAPDLTRAVSFHWPGDRQANKEASAQAALELLQSYLESIGGGGPPASQPG